MSVYNYDLAGVSHKSLHQLPPMYNANPTSANTFPSPRTQYCPTPTMLSHLIYLGKTRRALY